LGVLLQDLPASTTVGYLKGDLDTLYHKLPIRRPRYKVS